MVYGRYNELVNGVYKPTYNWWGTILCIVPLIIMMMIINYLVGGLEHEFYVSIYWECHHPN